MLKTFANQKQQSIDALQNMYPDSMFLVKNLKDINNPSGTLVALSEKADSFRELCILKTDLEDEGESVCIFGTYNREKISVQREFK